MGRRLIEAQVGADQTLSFAAGALVTTTKFIDVTRPHVPVPEYELICFNPSTISDLTVKLCNRQAALNGETRHSLITAFGFAKAPTLVIEDCEDTWAESDPVTGVILSAEGTIKLVGTYSAKMAMGATAAAGILATEAVSVNISMYTHIRLWVRSSIGLSAGALQFLIDDSTLCASPLETLDIPALDADTWTQVFLPLSDPTLLTAVISLGVKQVTDLGAFDLFIDDVNAVDIRPQSRFVHGIFNGGDMRMVVSNDTALTATIGACAPYFRIREVE